jgi:alkylation response protein AidB-like acyl-CoA dehydrogenase
MNFGFNEEQELLRKTARDFLGEHAPMKRVREAMEGSPQALSGLWKQLAELGWTGLALPERYGGAGLTPVELTIVIEELGRSLAPVPFLPTCLAARAVLELGDESQRGLWLPKICSGAISATLALAEERGSDDPADVALRAVRSSRGFELEGRKLFVPDAAGAGLLVVVARTGGEGEKGLAVFAVPRETPGVSLTPMHSMDLLRPLFQVDFDAAALPESARLGAEREVAPALRRVLDDGMVMVCAEMLGGAQKCLEDSVAYAKERVQFGKPIGVNQAVKHKCADMLFEVESARSITYYAAWAARERNEEAAVAAAMAKAYLSDAYRRVSADNIQIHGGVGFTWEYDCHLYFKRAKSDEVWLGDARYHRERLARLLGV